MRMTYSASWQGGIYPLGIADKASSASGDGMGRNGEKADCNLQTNREGDGGPTHSHMQGCTKRFEEGLENILVYQILSSC